MGSRNLLLNRAGREKATLWLQWVEDTTEKRLWARDAFKNLNLIDAMLASISSVQSLSSAQLCDPMNRSTPGLPAHHLHPKSTQTRIHWVGDAIQPSHPLSSPSSPALSLSQHQGKISNESALHIGVPKYWSFSFNISPSNGLNNIWAKIWVLQKSRSCGTLCRWKVENSHTEINDKN